MRKVLAALTLLFVYAISLAQAAEPQNYKLTVGKFVKFYNDNLADSIFHLFSPEIRKSTTIEQNRQTFSQLEAQLGTLRQVKFVKMTDNIATYKADFKNGTVAMKFNLNNTNELAGLLFDKYQPDEPAAQSEEKVAKYESKGAPDPAVTESPIEIKTFEGSLAGTLTMPKSASGKIPVVLLIPGAGQIDRDGNSVKNNINTNSFKYLADALGKNGIAVARYDKRGVGESKSSTKESEIRFDDMIEDAIQLINHLQEDQRFSKIILLGHAEGSLVSMLATKDEPVSGLISVEGAGEPGDKVIMEQMKSQPDFISSQVKTVLDSLKRGKLYDKVNASVYFIARPSVQPYLITWMRFDPAREIRKVKMPILIIHGNTDLQVKVDEAEKLKKAKSDAILDVIPNMNFVMKDASEEKDKNLATYTDPNLPIKPELVKAIVDFVNKIK